MPRRAEAAAKPPAEQPGQAAAPAEYRGVSSFQSQFGVGGMIGLLAGSYARKGLSDLRKQMAQNMG